MDLALSLVHGTGLRHLIPLCLIVKKGRVERKLGDAGGSRPTPRDYGESHVPNLALRGQSKLTFPPERMWILPES